MIFDYSTRSEARLFYGTTPTTSARTPQPGRLSLYPILAVSGVSENFLEDLIVFARSGEIGLLLFEPT